MFSILEKLKYVGHVVAAEVLQKFVSSKTARISDVASGTGLVGEQLKTLGYETIDAVDCSTEMIEIARAKNIYENLYVQWIGGGKRLSFDDDTYDVIVCAGGFFGNGLKSDSFNEFVRVVKPGGFIVITMRAMWLDLEPNYNNGKLERDMQQLEKEGFWKLMEKDIRYKGGTCESIVTFVHRVC
ncbi:ubiquinone/menaquinone biosynthesis C-methyltransferase UbiE-like isoform X2 [Anneissia japonica]|uniref:ubiquinone/menaquinone biosynthesis C-methyltransferase UbiE-like isoform X2 n=1 Tax=Anneissia japonica TaxID=1529436 RepID=UPI001425586B|nr:ubiquinone/menaquinone biosynthesis C-methyltransferase UbiE-like isoform X2 [Anneissia japonica]